MEMISFEEAAVEEDRDASMSIAFTTMAVVPKVYCKVELVVGDVGAFAVCLEARALKQDDVVGLEIV